MIKLYKASNFKYTPFDDFVEGDLEYLKDNGVILVDDINDANIIISQNFKHIKYHFWKFFLGKKFLIWTLESRFNTHFNSIKKVFFGLIKCHIMNIYTQDVFVTNLTFHAGLINKKLDLVKSDFKMKSKKTIALMSYYKGLKSEPLLKSGNNIDLIALRAEIALVGNSLNVLDVYGKGWPNGISKEDSRSGDWVTRKKHLLENYHFNLSFENTAAYNYMTEKIWDSIENYCLPIYYGKHTNVYELFPEESFIDYSKFGSPNELFDFIENMKDDEFIQRLNKCIKVYNSISEKGSEYVNLEREKMLKNIVKKVKEIV